MLDAVWVEKYRPKTLDECILPLKTRRLLNGYARSGQIPDLVFAGPPGLGKTSAARALLNHVGNDTLYINAALEGNIDTIRTRVMQHASTVAFNGLRKFVLFEEIDKMTIAAQQALRAFIEEFSSNCGYIFTGNNIAQFDGAIQSRLTHVSFTFSKEEKPKLAKQVYNRIKMMLDAEKIAYDDKSIQHLLLEYLKYSNDIRQLLIRVQKYSGSGTFEPDLSTVADVRFQSLIDVLKSKRVKDIRTWAGENSDLAAESVFNFLFENVELIASPTGVASMIAHIAEHQFQHAFVANPEINVAALLLDIASESV